MRLAESTPELAGVDTGRPNPTEAFLRLIRQQVLARLEGDGELARGTHETDLFPALPELPETALTLARALARTAEPLVALRMRLAARLDEEADDMDAATRNRIEATCRSLGRRAIDPLTAWQAMLRAAAAPPPEPGKLALHVHFLRLDRREAGDRDVGLHRHWLDPTVPFATTLAAPAHGLLVTRRRCAIPATAIRKRPGWRRRSASARRICRCRRSAPRSPVRSIMRRRRAPSW